MLSLAGARAGRPFARVYVLWFRIKDIGGRFTAGPAIESHEEFTKSYLETSMCETIEGMRLASSNIQNKLNY
jgi:hypothetical protein